MPPIVSIVGRSNSGKTTVVVGLIKELKARGYRVATVKHTPQEMEFDREGKDSWRHIEAGSDFTAVSAIGKVAMIKPVSPQASLAEIARLIGEDYDILLAEGFKQEDAPKIEVHRRKIAPPLEGFKLIAIATDEPLETTAKQYAIDDFKGLVDLIEKDFILPYQERISLYVNGVSVPLSSFPGEIITNILLAMASSLKRVGKVGSLDIHLRKKSEGKPTGR